MTTPLEIDFKDATDTQYEQFHFRQAGLPGMKLPGCWLFDFVKCLEMSPDLGKICVYQDYWIENKKTGSEVRKSSIGTPLLSIDAGQRAKLIAHLKSTYAALL